MTPEWFETNAGWEIRLWPVRLKIYPRKDRREWYFSSEIGIREIVQLQRDALGVAWSPGDDGAYAKREALVRLQRLLDNFEIAGSYTQAAIDNWKPDAS